jgi:hypothetical protein
MILSAIRCVVPFTNATGLAVFTALEECIVGQCKLNCCDCEGITSNFAV